jgi:subfamily B ATP-binding cassette protein MsbA
MKLIQRLLPYLKPYRLRFLYASIAMLIVAGTSAVTIYVLRPIIDEVFVSKDFSVLPLIIAGVPALYGVKSAAAYVQNYLMSWIGQRVTQELRDELFRHLHTLSLDFYSATKSGEVLAKVTNDLSNVQSALQFLPLYLIRDTLTVVGLLGVLFYLNWSFALLALIGIPVSSIFLVVLGKKMRDSSRESQVVMGEIYHRFQESLQSMMVIKAFNYEAGAIAKFRDENNRFFDQMMRYLRATALSGPLMEFFGSLVIAGLIYYGAQEVAANKMTSGGFFAFLAAVFAAYAPTKNLARMNSELQRGLSSGERIFSLLDEKPKVLDAANASQFEGLKQNIRLEGVRFRYPSRESDALNNVDMHVNRGETIAIVGPSGSGKSTLVQLLLRLYDPNSGSLLLDDKDLREWGTASVRRHLGLVTQETVLFNDNVAANIAIGRKDVSREDVERAAKVAAAHDFIAALPEGYDTMLGDRGMRLSGGQRQRLAIARAVLANPEILILDEATSNLDSTSEREVQAALERLMKGRTVIVIAHRLSTVRSADRIYVMDAGKVIEEGSHSNLLKKDGLYKRLYELQAAGAGAQT